MKTFLIILIWLVIALIIFITGIYLLTWEIDRDIEKRTEELKNIIHNENTEVLKNAYENRDEYNFMDITIELIKEELERRGYFG